jgi:uncharacterized protein (DUF362 family)
VKLNRREFLLASGCALQLVGADAGKTRVGLVQSAHARLPKPSSIEDPLDYPRVRDMVWKAIEYGKPRAGSLEAKIRPGSWVVIKPNIVFLKPQVDYTTGDITDFRVTQAVLEYVATKSRAGRITIAEGGSYRQAKDPNTANMVVTQNGVRVTAPTFDWGDKEFPGWSGTLGGMIQEFRQRFPDKRVDYVDLAYDALRDASGKLCRVEVARTPRGVGAFGARPDYFVTNTIPKCDFLISVPVMKVHGPGITACLKNYVGTAPREAYAPEWRFSNRMMHDQHDLEGRIDGLIVDLASFHPPDYNVVDGLRGLQYATHNIDRQGQMVQNNVVLAGEDPVAVDATVATIMGFNRLDMDYLHMAMQREMGTMDFGRIEVIGDQPDRAMRRWAKTKNWHGRGNREWLVSTDAAAPLPAWKKVTARTDTLYLAKAAGDAAPGTIYGSAVRVYAEGPRKANLWVGCRGRVVATLNGEKVMEEENATRYRVGQFQAPVELRAGENLLVFRTRSAGDPPQLSALLVDTRNEGDTVQGIRWSA